MLVLLVVSAFLSGCEDDDEKDELSFGPAVRVNDPSDHAVLRGFPSMAVDRSGTIFIAWNDGREDDNQDIFFARSTDGGRSFSPNVRVNDVTSEVQLFPRLAVGLNGWIHVVWYDERNRRSEVYFTRSTDRGRSFEPSRPIGDPAVEGLRSYPDLTVGPGGELYLVWKDTRHTPNGAREDIYLTRSTDGGTSFEPEVRVNDDAPGTFYHIQPAIAVDSSGGVHVVWEDSRLLSSHIFYARSTDGGRSFGPNVRVDDTTSLDAVQLRPGIAVDRSGVIHVAFWDDRAAWNVYYSRSLDGGMTFSTNRRVNLGGGMAGASLAGPNIAVDGVGRAYVGWDDRRRGLSDSYIARNETGTGAFEPNLRVTNHTDRRFQYDTEVAVDASGEIYAAWMEARDEYDSDIFVATTRQ